MLQANNTFKRLRFVGIRERIESKATASQTRKVLYQWAAMITGIPHSTDFAKSPVRQSRQENYPPPRR
jgi:hypothetical protein